MLHESTNIKNAGYDHSTTMANKSLGKRLAARVADQKLHSRRLRKIKFKKCLIIYGPEYFDCTFVVQTYKNVLCGCEEWSLTLREGHRLGVFEKKLLRKIFGPKRDEVTRGWRRLHNEELYNLAK
jgi:hypothetical protein